MKRSLPVAVVVAVSAALWSEHSHRVVIDAPLAADATSEAAAAGCAENDTMPYSDGCVAFLAIATRSVPRTRGPRSLAAPAPEPCPDNDRIPYSASCIAFMIGATETGMRWRVTSAALPWPEGIVLGRGGNRPPDALDSTAEPAVP